MGLGHLGMGLGVVVRCCSGTWAHAISHSAYCSPRVSPLLADADAARCWGVTGFCLKCCLFRVIFFSIIRVCTVCVCVFCSSCPWNMPWGWMGRHKTQLKWGRWRARKGGITRKARKDEKEPPATENRKPGVSARALLWGKAAPVSSPVKIVFSDQ